MKPILVNIEVVVVVQLCVNTSRFADHCCRFESFLHSNTVKRLKETFGARLGRG